MEISFSEKERQGYTLMEAIFREHYVEVHAFILHKVRRPEIADDLTSVVFLKALRWLLEDRGMRQVRSWLYAAARTTLADYWQEQAKGVALPLEALEDYAIIPHELEQGEAQVRVQRLLSLLPERERQVLLLRYMQGYTAVEVGRELGLTPGHVRVLQLRALRRAALFETEERKLSAMHEIALPYTKQGQHVLELAREEALALQHYYIGPEHLLLGILAEGSAAAPLAEQSITLEHVRSGLLFLVGRDQGGAKAETAFTPQARHILAGAEQQAQADGEKAISPHYILSALQSAESEYGITYGLLQSLGVERRAAVRPSVDEQTNESALALADYLRDLTPTLSPEQERQLAHTVTRSEREKKRAESRSVQPDSQVIEEGKLAYYQLFMACQEQVFTIIKEYLAPGRDVGKLLDAANRGLTYAIYKFGLKQQVSFRAYASHWIHLEIMELVLE